VYPQDESNVYILQFQLAREDTSYGDEECIVGVCILTFYLAYEDISYGVKFQLAREDTSYSGEMIFNVY
jgi:uncharacterized protein YwqG